MEFKEEEEAAPLLIQSRYSRGPAILEGVEVAEGLNQRFH